MGSLRADGIHSLLSPESLDGATLRNTADMAILVTDGTLSDCSSAIGVGYLDKNTVGVVAKACSITSLGFVSVKREQLYRRLLTNRRQAS